MSAEAPVARDHRKIGLCLSGGGFRASFYALGVLRYLAEARLLERVVAISAVSGGSIAAGAVGDGWTEFRDAGGDGDAFREKIDRPFRETVTSKNIRRRWMLGSVVALIPFTGGRGGAYARTLAHNLYRHSRVVDLPKRPEIIFTSTDLSRGRAFRVAAAYVGSWDYGYIEPTPTSIGLGKAVAASAAFPPSMTVVNLRTKRLAFPVRPPKTLSLVDGGVYDNLGLEWFQGWGEDARRPASATEPDFKIVANASGLLAVKDGRFWPVNAFPRDLAIQYQQSLNLRIRWNYAQEPPGSFAYLAIKSDPRAQPDADPLVAEAALPSELVGPLALLRTDLDRFSEEEANLLSYHAYWTLHARLRANAPELAIDGPGWRDYANLSAADTEGLRKIVQVGAHRFFRRVRRRLPWGWGA
jgi:predicted acylesterase/phospholipase RssA